MSNVILRIRPMCNIVMFFLEKKYEMILLGIVDCISYLNLFCSHNRQHWDIRLRHSPATEAEAEAEAEARPAARTQRTTTRVCITKFMRASLRICAMQYESLNANCRYQFHSKCRLSIEGEREREAGRWEELESERGSEQPADSPHTTVSLSLFQSQFWSSFSPRLSSNGTWGALAPSHTIKAHCAEAKVRGRVRHTVFWFRCRRRAVRTLKKKKINTK